MAVVGTPDGGRAAPDGRGADPRKVLVTPSGIPTGGTAEASESPFFVDWVSISQVHADGIWHDVVTDDGTVTRQLLQVDSGCVWSANDEGEIEWRTLRAVRHEGSFETSVAVRCDGYKVTFSGNMSRFGRRDNLFGFDVLGCVERINRVLATYQLPPFTPGTMLQRLSDRKDGTFDTVWSGARISRLDLTANFEAGSADDAHAFLQWLATQKVGRKEGRTLGQGETVDWGGKRQYWKAYIKHLELARHEHKNPGLLDPRVIEHCAARGVVRFEGTVRSKTLGDLGAAFLGDHVSGFAMGQLVNLFNQHATVLDRAECSTDDLDSLPRPLRATARDYLAGMDLPRSMTKSTFYRHRLQLLPYGIDIAVRNVKPFQPRVRVVQLARAEVPSWYQLAA